MSDQLSGIVLDLFIIIFLLTNKPSKEWMVFPPINKTTFVMYVVMCNLSTLFFFQKIIFNNFDDLCFACTYSTMYVLQ
jgi:hypothetical protein